MIRPFEHGGNIYRHAKGEVLLDYSANINPLGLDKSIKAVLTEHLDDIVHYPDPDCTALRHALAQFYELPEASVLPGNGAAELLYLFFQHVRPRRVCIPVPAFSEYERAARSAGTEVVYFPLLAEQEFQPDLAALDQAAGDSDCIVLGNPNNPTGNLIARDELLPFARRQLAQGRYLILDESFLDFRRDADRYSLSDLAAQSNHLLIIHSLTKFYALPGLRLGFGIAAPALLRGMMEQTDVWHVNVLAQLAGTAAVKAKDYQERSRELLAEEQAFMVKQLLSVPNLKVYKPTVNFILCQSEHSEWTASALAMKMRENGILIRDCRNYPGLSPYYFRLAIRGRENNKKLIKNLKSCFKA